jgi:hypothetical protein
MQPTSHGVNADGDGEHQQVANVNQQLQTLCKSTASHTQSKTSFLLNTDKIGTNLHRRTKSSGYPKDYRGNLSKQGRQEN